MNELLKKLQMPFDPQDIEWRVARAMQTKNGNKAVVLAYVTNRAIMNRFDEVFGPLGWKNEFKEWKGSSQLCGISIKHEGEWITKWDGADNSNIEGTKGGLSDSMKRAAVQWGVGRYLYNLEENWVDVKDKGQNYINSKIQVNKQDVWIKGYWDTPILPNWALPKYKTEDVIQMWVERGGSEEKFDEYITKNFNVSRDKLTQSHLAGLKKKMEMSA
jgi:hypothetical protein